MNEMLYRTAVVGEKDSALDRDGLTRDHLRHLHLEAVALQREFPELLGPRRITNCPYDDQAEPRSALASYMRAARADAEAAT